jgi:hypothetical protein
VLELKQPQALKWSESFIHPLVRYGSSDSSSRVVDVARSPWNQVNVGMHHCLPCGTTAIAADVETYDTGIGHCDTVLKQPKQIIGIHPLLLRHCEGVDGMPSGEHKCMSRRDGVLILDGDD